jgi:WD40 repeat protein
MRTCLVTFAVLITGTAIAAPLPKDMRPVITPESVARLKPVNEIDRDVYRLVWGPANGQVAILSFNHPTEILDAATLKSVKGPGSGRALIQMAVARTGTIAWAENNTRVEIHKPGDSKPIEIETGQSQPDVVFSPDGKLLATGGSGTQAKLWDAATGKLIRAVDAGGEGGLTPVFSPDGIILAVGNRNDTTRLYEVATGKLLHTLAKAMTQGLKFSPDNKRLAIGYVDGTVGLWDVRTGHLEQSAPAQVKEVYEVDWSPKGDVLLTAGREGKIVLWDPKELKPIRELDSPEWVIQARFSPDGRQLWTAGGALEPGPGRKVVVWGLPDR